VSQPISVSGQGSVEVDADSQQPATGLGGTAMKNIAAMALLLPLAGGTLVAQEGTVRSLLSKDLARGSGKELSMITVEYPPGGSTPVHTHHAQVLVYVLEGSIVMQVKGGAAVTLKPGQTFYEGLDDVHLVSRNASATAPAKFVVFLVKDKGAPILTPVK
jgi:quercetin dioxygenase-like cupin family protein